MGRVPCPRGATVRMSLERHHHTLSAVPGGACDGDALLGDQGSEARSEQSVGE